MSKEEKLLSLVKSGNVANLILAVQLSSSDEIEKMFYDITSDLSNYTFRQGQTVMMHVPEIDGPGKMVPHVQEDLYYFNFHGYSFYRQMGKLFITGPDSFYRETTVSKISEKLPIFIKELFLSF